MSSQHTPYYGYVIRDYLLNVLSEDESAQYELELANNSGWEIMPLDEFCNSTSYFYGTEAHGTLDNIAKNLITYENNTSSLIDMIKESLEYTTQPDDVKDKIKYLIKIYKPEAIITTVYI